MDVILVLTIIGIIVATLIGGWQIYLAWRQLQFAKQQSRNASSSITLTAGTPGHKRRPYPREITEEIGKLPPAQREAASNNYVGLKVEWLVTLQAVHIEEKDVAHIMMLDRGTYPWIRCEVNLEQHPELRIATEGRQLWIVGEIASVRGNDILLAKARITID